MTGYADWEGHVIVCGLQEVGLRIVEQLSQPGVPAVVIDDDPDPRMELIVAGWGVPHARASSRIPATFTAAGMAGAIAVVCVYDDDLHTLQAALLARQLRADAGGARPGRPVHVLRRRSAVARLPPDGHPGGGLHGLRMDDMGGRTRVLAIRRAADRTVLEHLPRRATRFEPADEAYLIGPYDELLTVLRRDRPSPNVPAPGVPAPAPGPAPANPGQPRP